MSGPVAETPLARAAFATVVAVGVIAALYYGQIVLIPAALAVLLTFLLSPLVHVFERLRAGRVGAVLAVGVVAYSALGAAAWTVSMQTAALVAAVPGYRANIQQKIADVRGMGRGGSLERLQETLKDAAREASEQERAAAPRPPAETERVVVEADRTWDVWALVSFHGVRGGRSSPQVNAVSTTTLFGSPDAESRSSRTRSAPGSPMRYPKSASLHAIASSKARA